jgi:Arc/MetJ family transcription regulator
MAHGDYSYASTVIASYTVDMHRTTINLDQKKLSKVRRLLGTTGIKDTVERAFDEILAMDLRKRAVERLIKMDGLELADPTITASAWR